MKHALATIAALMLLLLPLLAFAQGDVPDVAQREVARRGNHVEQTGTIRSGLMAAALAPPKDDSDRWFLTLVYQPGEPKSEQMRKVVETDPALRAWIDTRDPSRSTMHYHLRSSADATQADWLANLRSKINSDGLPCVVVQPPKNGRFGPSATIVKLIHGVMSGEELSQRLRDGITTYVETIDAKERGESLTTSATQANGIGVPPPFAVRPKDPRHDPAADEPVEWPPVPPVKPKDDPPLPPAAPLPTSPAPSSPVDLMSIAIGIAITLASVMGWKKLAQWMETIRQLKEQLAAARETTATTPTAKTTRRVQRG